MPSRDDRLESVRLRLQRKRRRFGFENKMHLYKATELKNEEKARKENGVYRPKLSSRSVDGGQVCSVPQAMGCGLVGAGGSFDGCSVTNNANALWGGRLDD